MYLSKELLVNLHYLGAILFFLCAFLHVKNTWFFFFFLLLIPGILNIKLNIKPRLQKTPHRDTLSKQLSHFEM